LQRDLTLPFVDDGLFEVVGFRDAWHGLVLFAPNGHGTRLAQVGHIRFLILVIHMQYLFICLFNLLSLLIHVYPYEYEAHHV